MKPAPVLASSDVSIERHRSVVAAAERAGLMAGARRPVGARIQQSLMAAAKARSGIGSTTKLVEYALAKVAIEDDFGPKLLARAGSVPADFDFGV